MASEIIITNENPANIVTPSTGRISIFADSTNNNILSFKDEFGAVSELGSGANPLIIPNLQVKIQNINSLNDLGTNLIVPLQFWWNGQNTEFLNNNPKIALFRYKNKQKYSRNTTTSVVTKISNKGWVHPANGSLNTSAFGGGGANSTLYGKPSGRVTEFTLPTTADTKTKIQIDPTDWFYLNGMTPGAIPMPYTGTYTDIIPYGRKRISAGIGKKYATSQAFRFCIMIDNPLYTTTNKQHKYLYGPLTDPILFYYMNNAQGNPWVRLHGHSNFQKVKVNK